MPAFILKLVIHYVMAEVQKLETSVDWDGLEEKLDADIKKFFPQGMADATMLHFAHIGFTALKEILTRQDDLEMIITLMSEQKFPEALAELEDLLKQEMPISITA